MTRSLHADLAKRYFLEDLPGATQLGARLNGILLKIDAGEQVTALQRQFLATTGLHALVTLAEGKTTLGEFRAAAEQEQKVRIEEAAVKALKDAAELAERTEARAAAVQATFAAMANDPALRRKREAKELRQRFGVGYIESEDYPRAMGLLRQVANGQRLKVDDLAWLKTEADYCWTDELQRAWHALEAAALTKAWESSGDTWNAVNASGHWRKAGEPERALRLTDAALAKVGSNPKIRSALATTRGGAMRDLRRLDEAKGRLKMQPAGHNRIYTTLTDTTEATTVAQFPGVTYRELAGEILPFSMVWSAQNDNPACRRLMSLARSMTGFPGGNRV